MIYGGTSRMRKYCQDYKRHMRTGTEVPERQVRAVYDDSTVIVYQAYSPEIADAALAAGRFTAPFKRDRMTWIKPSKTWMMYRSGVASKPDQERILAIHMSKDGFERALSMAVLTAFDSSVGETYTDWVHHIRTSPVRVQWDPERCLHGLKLPWRAIQVGLSDRAVDLYTEQWITHIEDVTSSVRAAAQIAGETDCRPSEPPYPLSAELARRLGVSQGATPAG